MLGIIFGEGSPQCQNNTQPVTSPDSLGRVALAASEFCVRPVKMTEISNSHYGICQ